MVSHFHYDDFRHTLSVKYHLLLHYGRDFFTGRLAAVFTEKQN